MMKNFCFITSAVYLTIVTMVEGHGRLIQPPARGTMWRYGFKTDPNYNDNEMFCGGFANQWQQQGGKCGICGDPYQGPREHEVGGTYFDGTVVKNYNVGSEIAVEVQITAHHKGWFEFRLCQHDERYVNVTQECLDKHLLVLQDGSTRYYLPEESSPGTFTISVTLPMGLTCAQCVFQWKYHTGNSWGCDSENDCDIGKGPQEEFYGCADVAISGSGVTGSTTTSTVATGTQTTTNYVSSTPSTTTSTTSTSTTTNPTTTTSTSPITTTTNPTTTTSTSSTTTTKQPTDPPSTDDKVCKATGIWVGVAGMHDWCKVNCQAGNCPESHCKCIATRKATTTQNSTVHPTTVTNNPSTTIHLTSVTNNPSTTIHLTSVTNNPTTTVHPTTLRNNTAGQSTTISSTAQTDGCSTYVSKSGSQFDDFYCQYDCLIENTCRSDDCVCSTGTPAIKRCTGPSSLLDSDRICSFICAYGICPNDCHCV